MKMHSALIVIDYQHDFAHPNGSLYVKDGEILATRINFLASIYPLVLLTQDWHELSDPSFKENGGQWPVHCIRGTPGAEIMPIINYTNVRAAAIFRKSVNSAVSRDSGLIGYLKHLGIDSVHLCGLALDYCVRETAIEMSSLGWDVSVLRRATLAVDISKTEELFNDLEKKGVKIL